MTCTLTTDIDVTDYKAFVAGYKGETVQSLEQVGLGLISPKSPPADTGYEILDSRCVLNRDGSMTITVVADVKDVDALNAEAERRYLDSWNEECDFEGDQGEMLYEILFASNSLKDPALLGYEIRGHVFEGDVAPAPGS